MRRRAGNDSFAGMSKGSAKLVRQRVMRLLWASLAVLPIGCATKPVNPFAGAWTTPENQQIAFRADTLVINPPGAGPTPMAGDTCANSFRFGYGRKSREALLELTPRQPDLRNRLAGLLVQPDYPVAELACGEGESIYVLLDERELVAIHRDRDVAGIERLSRL